MEGLTWTYYGICLLVPSVSVFPCLSLLLITIILSSLHTSPSPLSLSFISFPSPFYFDRVFLYNPNLPGTHCVGHTISNFQQSFFFFFVSYVLELQTLPPYSVLHCVSLLSVYLILLDFTQGWFTDTYFHVSQLWHGGIILFRVWRVLSFSRVLLWISTPLIMVHLVFAFSILPIDTLRSGKTGANFLMCRAVVREASLDTELEKVMSVDRHTNKSTPN